MRKIIAIPWVALRNIAFGLALSLAVVLGSAVAYAPAAHAQGSAFANVSIAVVNVQQVLDRAKATQDARRQLGDIRSRFESDLAARENDLRTRDQQLRQQRALLAPDTFNQRLGEFQRDSAALQKSVRQVDDTLKQAFDQALGQLRQALAQEVAKMAKERGLDLVLPASSILVAANALDLSDEALRRLDARVQSIAIDVPLAIGR